MMGKPIDQTKLQAALTQLNKQLQNAQTPRTELVVCGGSALIAMGLVPRTTRDLDIIAMVQESQMVSADPLPGYLMQAASKVAKTLSLPENWLNNGPASQFQLGLPDGFQNRLTTCEIGEKLVVHYIGRLDQIFFKVFAAADRGGYHVNDLRLLNPSEEELVAAGKWCMTIDVSPAFREILKNMFEQLGWKNVSDRI